MQHGDQSEDLSSLTETVSSVSAADGSHEAAKMATTGQEAGGTDVSQNDVPVSPVGLTSDDNVVPCDGDNDSAVGEDGEKEQVNGEMSEEGNEESDRCENDANFAAVCSFFLKFGHALGISYSIEDLKVMLEDHQHVHEELTELHIKLLRKRRKYINKDKWEKSLVKFVSEYNNVDAWELERFGYRGVKTGIRLELLKRLLEAQFDFNSKFKSEVNCLDANSMRIMPIGRDIKGNQFWHQLDEDANIRIYKEVADDASSWSLVCKDTNDLIELMDKLRSESTLQPVKDGSSGNVSDDSSDSHMSEENQKGETSDQPKPELAVHVKEEFQDEKAIASPAIGSENSEPANPVLLMCKKEENDDDLKSGIKEHSEEETSTGHQSTSPQSPATESVDTIVNSIITTIVDSVVRTDASNLIDSPDKNYQRDRNDVIIVQEVCSLLISQVCNQAAEESSEESTKNQSTPGRSGSGSGRGRGRGRGRGKGRGRGGRSATASESTSRTASVTRPSARRYLSRELMELNGLAEQELLFSKEDDDTVPRIRQSRRIQQLQEKKETEFKERMVKEQERLEAAAKRKSEMIAERERKREEYQSMIQNGSKLKGKKYQIQKGCLDTSSDSEYEEEKNSSSEEEYMAKKKGRHRKGKGKRGSKACPWMDSSGTSHAESDESEEIADDDDEDILKFDDNDDEFACEDIEPEVEPVVLKRARTVRKAKSISDSSDDSGEEAVDEACKRCSKADHPEWILLCDRCDSGFHTSCLIPPLMLIPDGDWFCPPCENVMLIERLELELAVVTQLLQQKEKEELKKQRLKYVSVCVDNIISSSLPNGQLSGQDGHDPDSDNAPDQIDANKSRRKKRANFSEDESGESSENDDEGDGEDDYDSEESEEMHVRTARRAAKKISYKFAEYDELINSAIRASDYEDNFEVGEEADEEDGQPRSRGKDMATIEHAAKEAEARAAEAQGLDTTTESAETVPCVPEAEVIGHEVEAQAEENEDQPKKQQSKKGAKKRRLNDLDSPSEEDDSDESFKGSSDTEVEEASDENASGDGDTEEEESDDSDFQEYRRKAARTRGSSGKRRRGEKRKKGSRRGYHRDGFVIDSDDDFDAPKGRSRTRGAAAKRKSYREVSTDEDETEEEWRSDSPVEKKKSRKEESESSDEEWGAKKKSAGKKKKSWGADDEPENEEEENDEEKSSESNGEEEDEEESSEEEEVKPKAKAKAPVAKAKSKKSKKKATSVTPKKEQKPKAPRVPKVKSPPKISERTYEMRGKPRMSKARIMSLREKDEDEEDTEEEVEEEQYVPDRKRKAPVIEDADDVEAETQAEPDTKDEPDNAAVPSDQQPPNPMIPVTSPAVETPPPPPAVILLSQPPVQPTSRPSTESPLIAAALIGPGPQRFHQPHHMQRPPQMPDQMRQPGTGHNAPVRSTGVAEQSALSALTLFASRGPAPEPAAGPRHPPPQFSSFPHPSGGSMSSRRPEYPATPGPPPLQAAPPAHRLSENEQYTITSLESYGRPKPLKPTKEMSHYAPSTTSPPKLMNLDAPSYSQPPPRDHYERYPQPGARFPVKTGPNPLMSHPPPYAGMSRPEFAGPDYSRGGAPAELHHRPHSFPAHRHYYAPATTAAPFQPVVDPRHPMFRSSGSSHPQSGHRASPYESRPSQGHGGPPAGGYYPHPPHHNPEIPAGYYAHPHAGYPVNQGPGAPVPHGGAFGSYGPVPPPGMPPAHYAAFYAAAAAGAPNGAFMIQNILQANAAGGDSVPTVSSAATSH